MALISTEVKRRYKAFWNREAADRALLSITVPAGPAAEAIDELKPQTPEQMYTDIELRYRQMEHKLVNTLCFGEAFPRDHINFGPGALAAMIGGSHTWSWYTVWFGEEYTPLQEWDNLDSVRLDESSEVYRLTMDMTRIFAERSKGRYVTGISDIGGTLDVVASLRSTWNLLTDLYDYPQEILKAVALVDDLFETVFTRLYAILRQSGQDGMTTWMGLWNDRRYYPLQCDFSAMISPDAFAEFVMPSLRRGVDFLDNSVYHLDGAGELPHLDQLLSLERLDAIQWVPGDGAAPVWEDCWFPYYEKIQASGKGLILLDAGEPQHMTKLLKNLSHKGLYLDARLQSVEQAEEVIRKAAEWARK